LVNNYEVSLEELLIKADEIDRDIAMVSAQITVAIEANKFLNEPVNREWFRKVNFALSMKKHDLKVLNKQIGELKKLSEQEKKIKYQIKQQTKFERCFVDIAKEKLDSDLFKELISIAKQLQFERENGVNLRKAK
jgi:hypothetical protein